MKRIIFLSAILLFTATFVVKAQSKEEMKVAEVVEAFNNEMTHPNRDVFSNMVSDGLSYGHSSGLVQNKEEFLEDIVNGSFKFLSVSVTDQTISIVGNNAVVRHIFSAKFSNKGTSGDLKIGNLQVWVKEKGKWVLLARQAFKV